MVMAVLEFTRASWDNSQVSSLLSTDVLPAFSITQVRAPESSRTYLKARTFPDRGGGQEKQSCSMAPGGGGRVWGGQQKNDLPHSFRPPPGQDAHSSNTTPKPPR